MPLPAALLARLKKRGLVKEDKDTENEEILAENYEDDGKRAGLEEAEECEDKIIGNHLVFHAARCPNLDNPYHDCVEHCFKRYGRQPFRPHLASLRLRDRMLRRYPLPNSWVEVGDPDTGRFYYWNTANDEVAWLSPQHPKCKPGLPMEKQRRTRYEEGLKRAEKEKEREKEKEKEREKEKEDRRRRESDRRRSDRDRSSRRRRSPGGSAGSGSSSGDSSGSEDDRGGRSRASDHRRRPSSYSSRRDRDRDSDRRDRGRDRPSRKNTSDLDPMDPAAYSEAPRGTWNTGLGSKDEAKTGVDPTASGPLFQQRPYPSPGDILRANAARKEKARDSD